MKILNAIHAQEIGGVNQMFENYTKALINSNHQVFLLISDNKKVNYKNIEKVSKIFKLRNFSQIFDFIHLFFILILFRPKIVICHSNRVMKWMRFLSKITFSKSVAVNHGISFKNSLNCDFVININQEIQEMVANCGFQKDKNFILKNSILIKQKYQERNFNYKKPKIGIYGRFESRKGFDILLKSCLVLKQKNFDFSIKIGGFNIPDSQYNVKNIAKDLKIIEKCEFYGIVKDKQDFFKDIDIFIVPSREEPFGLVILEGFENSVLTISSNTVGGKMLINHNENGLLFENENCKDLADKIEFIIKNHQNYNNYTKNAYQKLEKQFSFNNFTKNLDEIIAKIANY